MIDQKREWERAQTCESVALCSRSYGRDVHKNARLLDLYQAATHIGLSYWTIREWIADGILKVVKLLCGRQRIKGGVGARKAGDMSSRKILIDRRGLDNLIEDSKENLCVTSTN